MNLRFLTTAIGLLTAAFFAQAQKQIADGSHGWYCYFGNHRLTERWGLHTEYQFRRDEFITLWQQSLLRTGIDFYLKDGAMLTAGYAWIVTYPYGEQPVAYDFHEHRIWEQFLISHRAGRFYFQHRYRLEQRFIETKTADMAGELIHDGYLFRNRFRYRGMVTVPLSRKALEDNTLFASLYDELFVGYGAGIAKNVLDQNRLSLTLGWRFNSGFNIQAGYLNQFVLKADGIRAERNHTAFLGMTYNVDFRKKEN